MMSEKNQLPTRPIVVACPKFRETSGGAIVLHMLVHRLRELGAEAYALPVEGKYPKTLPTWLRLVKSLNKQRRRGRFKTHPSMDVPLATPEIAAQAIAVYPEIVSGNPFGSPHVVRWLLHKPGYFKSGVDLSGSDLIFFYQEAFAEGVPWIDPDNLLRVRWIRDDVYFDRGLPRSGSCRMKRKGSLKGTNAVPEPDTAIPLDGRSHEEIADVFNRTEVFFCHDPYTMYVYYAALCGCVPVVLPEPELDRDTWRSAFELKFGVAYGEDEIGWARETRDRLISDMKHAQEDELGNVGEFLEKIRSKFG